MVLVGNKDDLYEYEEVSNKEGIELAKQIKAIYQRTSAKEENGGIDELFKIIGRKVLDPNIEINTNLTKEERKNRGDKLMRDQIKKEKNNNKKGCC